MALVAPRLDPGALLDSTTCQNSDPQQHGPDRSARCSARGVATAGPRRAAHARHRGRLHPTKLWTYSPGRRSRPSCATTCAVRRDHRLRRAPVGAGAACCTTSSTPPTYAKARAHPVDYLVALLAPERLPPIPGSRSGSPTAMWQRLLFPPTVAGWGHNATTSTPARSPAGGRRPHVSYTCSADYWDGAHALAPRLVPRSDVVGHRHDPASRQGSSPDRRPDGIRLGATKLAALDDFAVNAHSASSRPRRVDLRQPRDNAPDDAAHRHLHRRRVAHLSRPRPRRACARRRRFLQLVGMGAGPGSLRVAAALRYDIFVPGLEPGRGARRPPGPNDGILVVLACTAATTACTRRAGGQPHVLRATPRRHHQRRCDLSIAPDNTLALDAGNGLNPYPPSSSECGTQASWRSSKASATPTRPTVALQLDGQV